MYFASFALNLGSFALNLEAFTLDLEASALDLEHFTPDLAVFTGDFEDLPARGGSSVGINLQITQIAVSTGNGRDRFPIQALVAWT